jgi:hypothetical protein
MGHAGAGAVLVTAGILPSMSTAPAIDDEVFDDENVLSPEESWRVFDAQCRYYLHLSGEEFIRAFKAGELLDDDTPENFKVGLLADQLFLFQDDGT